jgi:hypothetical protein
MAHLNGMGEVIRMQHKHETPCFVCPHSIPRGHKLLRIRWLSSSGLGLFGYFHEVCGEQMIRALNIPYPHRRRE